jgi:single-stranded-DNA-specific exonuclease
MILGTRIPHIETSDNPERIFAPDLSDLIPPDRLADAEKAASRVATAVRNGEIIAIETDHDVDGVTSHAIIRVALELVLGVPKENILSFVGHRMNEGYGLSEALKQRILTHSPRPSLVITADNGSTDEPRIADLKRLGIDVIVTDHHQIPETGIPESAYAVINPTRQDCAYPDKTIAGCHVAWLLMCMTVKHFGHASKVLVPVLDYVALGTVADCVSLAGVQNRILVRAGLARINAMKKPCWRVMAEALGKKELTEQDLAFFIGPHLNAHGRLNDAMAGVRFLLSRTDDEAKHYFGILAEANRERKQIQTNLTQTAIHLARETLSQTPKTGGLALYLPEGHAGVHGIVASRIVEQFGLPTVCLSPSFSNPEHVTGSARQIEGFDVHEALKHIHERHPDLLIKFGGHKGAGGLTIHKDSVRQFVTAWNDAAQDQINAKSLQIGPRVYYDCKWDTPSLLAYKAIRKMIYPFGRGFEEPVFRGTFEVVSCRHVGAEKNHLAMILKPVSSDENELPQHFNAIWFNADSGQTKTIEEGERKSFLYQVSENHFNGKVLLQLIIKWAF